MSLLDLDQDLKTTLIEEYANEKKPSDGEIYLKIRQYQLERNLWFEKRWWARLSEHGRQRLEQLFRHRDIAAAFDALREIKGLWEAMRIKTLHKMFAMKCDEVSRISTGCSDSLTYY